MGHATILELDGVASELAWMDPPPFFFGASVLPLYLDVPGIAAEARPTEDVDVLLAVTDTGPMHRATAQLEATLEAHGWKHDLRAERRNIFAFVSRAGVPVDVVPYRPGTEEVSPPGPAHAVLDWPVLASSQPMTLLLPSGRALRIPTPAFFLACKIAASRNPKRWDGPYESKDIEDIALLATGCSTLRRWVVAGPPALHAFLKSWASEVQTRDTAYGGATAELLLANAPRMATPESVTQVVDALCSLDG